VLLENPTWLKTCLYAAWFQQNALLSSNPSHLNEATGFGDAFRDRPYQVCGREP